MEFDVAATGQVARFELHFQFALEQLEALTRNEIDAQAGVLEHVRLTGVEKATAENALAGIAEQQGLLRQAIGVFKTELDVGDVFGLAGKRHTVLEVIQRTG